MQVSTEWDIGGCRTHIFHVIRANPKVQERKSFHKGGNSSCRQHIRQHYEQYKAGCESQGISMSQRAIPLAVLKAKEAAEVADKKGKKQGKLNAVLISATKATEFSREAVLDAITQFIVCDDQALSLPDKPVFRNCLVAMRPRTTSSQLPSTRDVENHIKNEFVKLMKNFKTRISVRFVFSSFSRLLTQFHRMHQEKCR
jgi:hypothetical protein